MFTRSSRHYQGIMTSFFPFCIVLGTMCVNPLSAELNFTVSGQVGSTAVLPCELQSEVTGTPHISWTSLSGTVFERCGEKTYQGERYKGRVDVPVELLRKRNCSLVLRNLTPNDTTVYWSYHVSGIIKAKKISRINLSVDEKENEENNAEKEVPRASQHIEDQQQKTTPLTLDCNGRGVWTGVGVGAAGTIAVIGVIGAVVYWCKRRRNQNHRNPDPPQTNSLPNTQINPANTSQDENPNDQGEHLLLNTSQDDHGSVVLEEGATRYIPVRTDPE